MFRKKYKPKNEQKLHLITSEENELNYTNAMWMNMAFELSLALNGYA